MIQCLRGANVPIHSIKQYVSLLRQGSGTVEQRYDMVQSLLFKFAVMKPDKVVEIAYPKMIKGKRLIIPGLYNKLLVFFSKIMPVGITNRLTLFMMK